MCVVACPPTLAWGNSLIARTAVPVQDGLMIAEPRSLVDSMVDATPSQRDRAIDGLRALCIAIVVLWHWVFSITHRAPTGRLTMPNPLDTIPLGWSLTWFLQPMPIFFLVGGFANMAMWQSLRVQKINRPSLRFLRRRLPRLLRPTAMFAVVTLGLHVLFHATEQVTLVPLWFMGVYLAIVLVAPSFARLDERFGRNVVVGMFLAAATCDVLRFAFDVSAARYVTTALAWAFCHQLGLAWRSGSLTAGFVNVRRLGLILAAIAAATMMVLAASGVYSPSMVTMRGQRVGNLFPSTIMLLLHAVFQTGLVLCVKPLLTRWFSQRRAWSFAIRVNAMAMTIFCWHMTALVAAIAVFERLGGTLGATANASWWSTRLLWVVGPGAVLAVLIWIFGRFERPPLKRAATTV
jgi:Acyltransferase family